MKKYKIHLCFGDDCLISAPDAPIDLSALGVLDEMETRCWDLIKAYANAFGLEITGMNAPDDVSWGLAKTVQDTVLDIFTKHGIQFNFGQESKESLLNSPSKRYELIEICGQKALFSDGRIYDSEVPDGLYRYDFREAVGSLNTYFGAIEKEVHIDHAGSFIVKEPLDLGTDKYIELEYDTEPNFLGEIMTVNEFINADFSQHEDSGNDSAQTGGSK